MSMPKREYLLYGQEFKADPFPIYARMREDDPICYHVGITGENSLWFVSRYEDVQTVLREHRRFVKNWRSTRTPEELAKLQPASELTQLLDHHMLNADGADHARLRSLVNKVFTTKMINQQREQIQSIADRLIDDVAAHGEMDLIDDFAFPLPIVVIAQILGIPPEDRDRFRAWSNAFVTPTLSEAEWQEAAVLLTQFVAYLRQLFDERRRSPKDDLITGLLQAEEDGQRLNEQELFAMVILLITAGHETTVNLIGNAMRALFAHPDQMTKLREEPSLIGNAVEEFLRYDGPVDRATMRFAAEDTELGGFTIRRGETIVPLLISANRDPRAFDNPDDLDITRQPGKHLGFGFGVHYCVGAPLARMEGAIAINTLLRRLPNLRLTAEISALEWSIVPLFHGTSHLPVKWDE
ncbi:cytochrome P450 [bacterium]|nr:cytochrome P450 [bacterium]